MNQVHGMYQASINRAQMTYVLSCLVVQPVATINTYGARK